jgi:hypothetical protein
MPLPRQLVDQMEARHLAESVRADRDRLRDFALTALQCVAWCALGMLLVAWSLHTTDVTYGRIAFFGGLALGNGGWIFAVLAAYRRGEQRGDW